MAYLVRSKSGSFKIRDGLTRECPMLDVGPHGWVEFENIPGGHEVGDENDADLMIKAADAIATPPPVAVTPEPMPAPVVEEKALSMDAAKCPGCGVSPGETCRDDCAIPGGAEVMAAKAEKPQPPKKKTKKKVRRK